MKVPTALAAALAAALALATAIVPAAAAAPSFSAPAADPVELTKAETRDLVRSLAALMADGYTDSLAGAAVRRALLAHLAAGRYRDAKRPSDLAALLGADVQAVIRDKHFNLLHFPPAVAGFKWVNASEGPRDEQAALDESRQRMRGLNFGVLEARVLEGNIGYLNLARFDAPPELLREPLAAAFTLLRHTDALVVDVRKNPGGHIECVQLAFSYFHPGPPALMTTEVNRRTGARVEHRTVADPGGPRYLGRPVFVLASRSTGSGGEMFTYQMKHHGRGLVVGDTTSGAAHSFDTIQMGSERTGHFMVLLPDARTVDALTGGDWEHTGVPPDVICRPDSALARATRLAIDSLAARTGDPEARRMYLDLAARADWEAANAPPTAAELATYAGRYGSRRVFVEDGRLRYQRDQGPLVELSPSGPATFDLVISASPRPRVRFELEHGAVRAMVLVTQGREERFTRDSP